jgi:hypothetical protein
MIFLINWTIVASLVAVYGALLSTWNAVTKHLESKPRIKVKVSFGFETFGSRTGPASILATALNRGRQPITLVAAGLRLPNHQTTHHFGPSGTAKFPHDLQARQNCYMAVPVRDVAGALKNSGFSGTIKVKAYYRDALDQTYTSRRFKLDIDKWLKASAD